MIPDVGRAGHLNAAAMLCARFGLGIEPDRTDPEAFASASQKFAASPRQFSPRPRRCMSIKANAAPLCLARRREHSRQVWGRRTG
jgi:hypothetical protein